MQRFRLPVSSAFATVLILSTVHVQSAKAESASVTTLRVNIQNAVCLNDWDTAVQQTSYLIGSREISSAERNQLIGTRRQFEGYRNSRTVIDTANDPNCQTTLAAQTQTPANRTPVNQTPVAVQPQSSLNWESGVASTNRQSGSSNRPNRVSSRLSPDDLFWQYYFEDPNPIMDEYANTDPGTVAEIGRGFCADYAAGSSTREIVDYYAGILPVAVFSNILVSGVSAYCPQYFDQLDDI